MKKRALIPTLILGTLLTGSLALAGPYGFGGGNCGSGGCGGPGDGGCGRGHGGMAFEQHQERVDRRIEMMTAVLDLNESQKAQMETLLDQQWQDHQKLREQMQAARDEMHQARLADPFNEAEFRSKAAKQAELKTEMMVEQEKMRQQLHAILTPEQQEKADKLENMMGGRGKGHHGGKGFRF